MINKDRDPYQGKDKFEKAGIKAEEKMAWYLKRAFGKSKDIYVFNDLRLQFDEGDYIQIDHFVLHPHGFIFIESKSVSSTLKIDKNEHWERLWEERWDAIPSPLKQVQVQANSFRQIIEEQTLKLREKSLFGLVQRKFDGCPFDVIVAISDKGKITGKISKEIMKAEAVCDDIKSKIAAYKKKWQRNTKDLPVYFRNNEPESIKKFLLKSHQEKHIKSYTPQLTESVKNKAKKTPQTFKKQQKINFAKPPFMCEQCSEPFEMQYGYSFYLYCPSCHKKTITVEPVCLQCCNEATLEKKQDTRVIEYQCKKNTQHFGIYHINKKLDTY